MNELPRSVHPSEQEGFKHLPVDLLAARADLAFDTRIGQCPWEIAFDRERIIGSPQAGWGNCVAGLPSRMAAQPRLLDQAMARQAVAQRRHALAHFWQCSMSWAAHCSAHQSQIFAHSVQISFANGLLRAIASTQIRQIAAHSMQHAGQSFGLSFPTIWLKQLPHSVAQSLHAAMQSRMAWVR